MPENAAAKAASHLTIVTSTEGDATIIRCSGKLVAGGTVVLQNQVRDLLPGSKRIVLDLADLGYMDSSGLGAIIGLHTTAKSAGGRLELINMSQRVRELFRITRVLSLFEAPCEPSTANP
jgi:anti-sigma B factor antagonist